MSYRFSMAVTLPPDELAAAMNLVYTDYAVPVYMTPEQIRARTFPPRRSPSPPRWSPACGSAKRTPPCCS
uniref:Uncharacterized protein n=1 Tax=uncultured Armatimonadetes bacterium TaxID=157466 RepID=A0A6J4J2N5_9BACT|nr:hypothetical protein AVDCRST_MAG63-2744 [uncultured Armatimonadetes bacterium]